MMSKAPRIRIADIFAALFVILSMLILLIALHIASISLHGYAKEVMTTTFIISLYIYEALLVFAGAGFVIHLLRYLAWYIITPKWLKDKYKGEKRG